MARCTTCSAVIGPVVAIDIDGTMGQYHGHLIQFMEAYTGRRCESSFKEAGPGSMGRWAMEAFGLEEHEFREAKLAYRQGGGKRSMPVYPGAALLCRTVRDAGAELWLTTTRPYLRLDSTDPDTRHWLHRHGIKYDHLLYDDNKYQRLGELVDRERVVMVLDDLPEMMAQAKGVFGAAVPVHMRNEYNTVLEDFNSVDDLYTASNVALQRIEQWNRKYK